MGDFAARPEHIIGDAAALRALFPPTHALAALKSQPFLDAHAQAFIRRSPFLCLSTQSGDGKADVSPRGDPAGFVRILDQHSLAIPDRPGNNRLDSLINIIANPSVGLLFMIPGFDDTLRVNGRAQVVSEPALLESMRVNDRLPRVAILVQVEEAFLHCAKAFRRAHLWNPAHFQDRQEMASLMAILVEQTTGAPQDAAAMGKLDEDLEADYRASMY